MASGAVATAAANKGFCGGLTQLRVWSRFWGVWVFFSSGNWFQSSLVIGCLKMTVFVFERGKWLIEDDGLGLLISLVGRWHCFWASRLGLRFSKMAVGC
ncbi:hypothetical protein Droror1_Dr00006320 [Drosera rotundifolia]